jgi:hypothetical protein
VPAIARPAATEHAPYYGKYIEQVPDGDLLALLARQHEETQALLRGIPRGRWGHRYEPGKWSIAEVAGHLADTERVFGYRALRFARADATPLPGFDENAWTPPSGYDARPLPDIADEFKAVRNATVAFVKGLDDQAIARRGSANGQEITVRALIWIIAGHERHHVKILKERYL